MKRIETKYFFEAFSIPWLTELIKEHLHGEIFTRSYPVHSLYFDTFDKQCYWSKSEGVHQRYKVRLRHYGSKEHFLEWKIKNGEASFKKRLKVLPTQVDHAISFDWPHEFIERPNNFLLPTLEIQYTRTEFTTPNSGVRLTIDEGTSFRYPTPENSWKKTYPDAQAILEIKMDIGALFDMNIWEVPRLMQLKRQSISKYADSLKQTSLL